MVSKNVKQQKFICFSSFFKKYYSIRKKTDQMRNRITADGISGKRQRRL
jgi:hypothetical protein